MSVTKGLGLSHKVTTILEGESLINDASGLIAYRLSLAAVSGTSFIIWKAGLQFVMLMVGGILVGMFLGTVLGWILKIVHKNSMVAISFTLLMPFVAYLVAEEIHVSGVICVVVVGMMCSQYAKNIFPDKTKEQSRSIWDIIVFLLNGLIFILIGIEFPYVLKNIEKETILPLVGYSFLICIVALLIRTGRLFLQRINLQKTFLKNKGRVTEESLLDWKSSMIIGWSGMRGIVSLATAIALPLTLENGAPFPLRNEIIFIAVAVVLITILAQGLSLPFLVRALEKHK